MRLLSLALLLVATTATAPAAQTWTNADVRGYGFVTGLLAHPRTQAVYARTDVGGIFRWDGARWAGVLDGSLTQTTGWPSSVESFALDARALGRIWAALGNGGSGIIVRSNDDGQTWAETGFPAGIAMAGNGAWRRAGERLAVDPYDSGVVYFGSREDGLWRTDDGGGSWSRVDAFPVMGDDGGPNDGPCTEPDGDGCGPGGLPFVVFDDRTSVDRDGRTVAANVYVGALGEGVYRSADGGRTWARAVPLPDTRDNPMRAEFAHGRLQVAVAGDGGTTPGGLWLYLPDDRGTGGRALDKTPPPECPLYGEYIWNAFSAHPTEPGYVAALPYGVTTRKLFFTRDVLADAPVWEVSTDEGTYAQCPSQQLDHTIDTPPWADPEDGVYSYAGAGLFDLEQPDRFWFTTGWAVYRADDLRQDGLVIDYQDVMRGLEELCVPDVAAPGGAGPAFYTAVFDAFGFPHTSAG